LEDVALLSVVAHCMPESFEDFVAFPPVGKVVEVDPIQVLLCPLPFFWWKGEERRLRLMVGMAKRISPWMWRLAWYKPVGGEWGWVVTGPVGIGRLWLSHRKTQQGDRRLEILFGLLIVWL
jgi:hypothetical protein